MLSDTSRYALRAVLHLAAAGAARPTAVDDIATALDIPAGYLSKTLQTLARAGVLTGTQGRGGGYRLAVPAARLRLIKVIAPFDDSPTGRYCMLGPGRCSTGEPCAAHGAWADTADRIDRFFRTTTVADLARSGTRP